MIKKNSNKIKNKHVFLNFFRPIFIVDLRCLKHSDHGRLNKLFRIVKHMFFLDFDIVF